MLNDQESGSLTRTSLKTLALVVIIILSITVLTKWQAATEATSTSYILDGSSNHGSYREDSSIIKDGEIIFESLDCAFHDSIRSKISQLHEGISERWNISHFPNFRTTMNIPASSWTLQKAKFIRLLLEANANHVLKDTASVASFGLSFVVGFSGSSVTAGHGKSFKAKHTIQQYSIFHLYFETLFNGICTDNYFKEAFPQVFHDSMAPIFQAMEVPFVVRNHALGNNPCYPYDACIAAHLGDDLDILAWEQVG